MGDGSYLNFDLASWDQYISTTNYLSRGASGNVYGPIKWNDILLALKHATFPNDKVTDKFKEELKVKKGIWTSLEHDHLTRIYSVDLRHLPSTMFIVMEFAAGGSLNQALKSLGSGTKLPNDIAADSAKQIAEGMAYLHERKIVHRDLKSSNILLMEPFNIGNPQEMMNLKITDFDDVKQHDHTMTMSGLVGTCAYMAPEVILKQQFSTASDVWSYGVVVWEMLSGDIPYKDIEPRIIMSKSHMGELINLPVPQSCPKNLRLLLDRCWQADRSKRTSFQGIIRILQSKDELPELNQWKPSSYKTISTKIAEQETQMISGLTIIHNELFVVSKRRSEIEVYDSATLRFNRQVKLNELIRPLDISSRNSNKCLYILDGKSIGHSMEILRVEPSGNLLKNWSTGNERGRSLSVTVESHVILSVFDSRKLIEYSPDGELIRKINLLSQESISFPRHALKLTNDQYAVCHGNDGNGPQGVCIVNENGNLTESFDGKHDPNAGQMNFPIYLSAASNGCVLVVDQGNSRVLLLDSNLKFKREILSKEHGLRVPNRILLDESNGRLFVTENECGLSGQIMLFQC